MNRDELTALRDVLDLILRLPDDLRAQVAAWLSPAAAKPGNGLDPHPPPVASTETSADSAEVSPRVAESLCQQSALRQGFDKSSADPGTSGRAEAPRGAARQPRIERRRARPSRRAEPQRRRRTSAPTRPARDGREGRCRALAAQGGGDAGGPYVGASVDLTAAPEADRTDPGPAPAPSRWIRPLAEYGRREPHEFACARFG